MADELFEQKKGTGLKYLGIGCLATVAILLIAIIVGVVVVMQNWRGWAAGGARDLMNNAIASSELSDEQKSAILAETDSFIDAFERGDVTLEELGLVAEAFAESPVVPMLAVYGLGQAYISASGLSEREQGDAQYQLRRLARGISEESIPPNDFNNILDPLEPDPGEAVATQVNANNINFALAEPNDVDDDELREFLANVKAAADEAGVPDEDYTIDYAAEIHKVIESALGRELPKSGP